MSIPPKLLVGRAAHEKFQVASGGDVREVQPAAVVGLAVQLGVLDVDVLWAVVVGLDGEGLACEVILVHMENDAVEERTGDLDARVAWAVGMKA